MKYPRAWYVNSRSWRTRNAEHRKSLSFVPQKDVTKHESSTLAQDLLNKETKLHEAKIQLMQIMDQNVAGPKKSISVLEKY